MKLLAKYCPITCNIARDRKISPNGRSTASTAGAARSRNHANHTAAHTNPGTPKTKNAARHPNPSNNPARIGNDNAAPSREPEKMIPFARPCSSAGSHV